LRNRRFILKLNIADTLGTAGNSVLDDLSFDDRANALEESAQMASLSALRDLLDEDGALVAVIFGNLGLRRGGVATAVATLFTTIAAAVAGPVAVPIVASIARGAGTRTTSTTIEVASTVTASTTSTAVARAATAGPITVFICVSTFA
jgi:hypothetical protein